MMKDELFDGFKVHIKHPSRHPHLWQAYFSEHVGIVGMEGESVEESVGFLCLAWHRFKNKCNHFKKPIPVPLSRKKFSGNFNVRISEETHRLLALQAHQKACTLNALVNQKLTHSTTNVEEILSYEKVVLERSDIRKMITLFFDEKIGLTFSESNLKEELLHMDPTENLSVDKDDMLKECFLNSPLKEAVLYFFSLNPVPPSSETIPLMDCLLINPLSLVGVFQTMKEEGLIEKLSTDHYLIIQKD